MTLQLPFDAALVLHRTKLRTDHPDVWRRYEANTVIRYRRTSYQAYAHSTLELSDLRVLRNYYELYLSTCELDPTERDTALCKAARRAVATLSHTIAAATLLPCR